MSPFPSIFAAFTILYVYFSLCAYLDEMNNRIHTLSQRVDAHDCIYTLNHTLQEQVYTLNQTLQAQLVSLHTRVLELEKLDDRRSSFFICLLSAIFLLYMFFICLDIRDSSYYGRY
jgi:uncharacterized coiled-coil protein SlyX